MGWVWDRSRSKGTERLLMLAIADHAHHDGTGAYPSNETLAEMLGGVDESTVRRLIRKCVALGELDVKYNAGGDEDCPPDKRPNLYTIKLAHAPETTKRARKRRRGGGGAIRTPGPGSGSHTPVFPQVTGAGDSVPIVGGAIRTPDPAERGCTGAPQSVLEPTTTPQPPAERGAKRPDRTNPRALGTNPRGAQPASSEDQAVAAFYARLERSHAEARARDADATAAPPPADLRAPFNRSTS